MAITDPFAAANKKKVRRGPDGLPIMEVDAARPPTGGYGVAATPFPITGQNQPARPMAVDAPPVKAPFSATTAGTLARNPNVPLGVPSKAGPDPAPLRPDPAFGQMGAARVADSTLPTMEADKQNAPPQNTKPSIPLNYAAEERAARSRYAQAIHSDIAGPLGSPESRMRIDSINAALAEKNAYARANAPLQKVQQPGEIADRHSELARQLVGYKRTKVEDMDKAIQAAMNEPLSEDKQRKIDVLVAQRASAADDLQKTLTDPYWQQTSPDQAAKIQAGQTKLRTRQEGERASGAADVAAYQGRQQYDRNAADEMRQAEFARQRAAMGAETAGYGAQTAAAQSVMDNKGLTPADRLAQAQTEAEIAAITRANAANSTGTTPEQAAAAQNARVNSATRYGVNEETMNNIARDLGVVAGGMSGVDSGRVAGGTFGGAENINKSLDSLGYEIDRLEQMAQTDAPVAADWANKILNSPDFPTPMGDGTYSVNLPLTGLASPATILPTMFNSPARAEAAKKLTAVRQRLVRIAGGR